MIIDSKVQIQTRGKLSGEFPALQRISIPYHRRNESTSWSTFPALLVSVAAAINGNIFAGKELASFQNPCWLPHVRSGYPVKWWWWRIFEVPDRRTPLGAVCCDTYILSSCGLSALWLRTCSQRSEMQLVFFSAVLKRMSTPRQSFSLHQSGLEVSFCEPVFTETNLG